MSLSREIAKSTRLHNSDEEHDFTRLRGPSQAAIDRSKNLRLLRKPTNIELIEDEAEKVDIDVSSLSFNRREISNSITAANGGTAYSREEIEQHVFRRRENIEPEIYDKSKEETQSQACSQKSESEMLQKCGLSKNAAITNLLKNGLISVQDLVVPNNSNIVDGTKKALPTENDTMRDLSKKQSLVTHPDDPDVMINEVLAYGGIDENKHSDLDFTVNRLGKKKTVTMRQYYLYHTKDSDFAFKKKS